MINKVWTLEELIAKYNITVTAAESYNQRASKLDSEGDKARRKARIEYAIADELRDKIAKLQGEKND